MTADGYADRACRYLLTLGPVPLGEVVETVTSDGRFAAADVLDAASRGITDGRFILDRDGVLSLPEDGRPAQELSWVQRSVHGLAGGDYIRVPGLDGMVRVDPGSGLMAVRVSHDVFVPLDATVDVVDR